MNLPRLIFCSVVFVFIAATSAMASVEDAVVKIFVTSSEYSYFSPWNSGTFSESTGSGCVIKGNRILTNAHVVSNQRYIEVQKYNDPKRYIAKLIAVSHEADLALLTVEDDFFFKGVKPLRINDLPRLKDEVVVYGYPEGGEGLSITTGVVSRIELTQYSHSQITLLGIQIDAAINSGNSGGPVLQKEKIVGVATETMNEAENIGYVVPAPVINHFLDDIKDGQYDGFPSDGIFIQALENETLKTMYGVEGSDEGVVVSHIVGGSSADRYLKVGDVILAIDGTPVANDGTIETSNGMRLSSDYLIKNHQVGDFATFEILRQGKEKAVQFPLKSTEGDIQLVGNMEYDIEPTYFIYGGLVFMPVNLNYLKVWGDGWINDSPAELMKYRYENKRHIKDEVIAVTNILSSELNRGYVGFGDVRIVEVNSQPFANLKEMIELVEKAKDQERVVFKTENGFLLAIDNKARKSQEQKIMALFDVQHDRSKNLRTDN